MCFCIYAKWIQEFLIYTFILDSSTEQEDDSATTQGLLNHKCYTDD